MREYLSGVLADRNIAVADGEEHLTGPQLVSELVKGLDALRVALRNSEHDLVLEQVDARAVQQLVQTVRVLVRIVLEAAVERVHLLRCGGNKNVAVRALPDLAEQVAGGGEVEGQGNILVDRLVVLCDLVQRLGHGGRREHGQLGRLRRLGVLCTVRRLRSLTAAEKRGQHQ